MKDCWGTEQLNMWMSVPGNMLKDGVVGPENIGL
jgi:hypothetical protein